MGSDQDSSKVVVKRKGEAKENKTFKDRQEKPIDREGRLGDVTVIFNSYRSL